MKILFFGTPAFAADVLQFLVSQGQQISAVVTKPGRPQGRHRHIVPSAVYQEAVRLKLPVHDPVRCSHPDFAPTLAAYEADLFLVVAYGEIIKEHLLKMPPLGCINIHASLLPAYRGAAPMQRALMAGDSYSGVTIMEMVKEMDAGDILATARVDIPLDMDCGALELALRKACQSPLMSVLNQLASGESPKKIAQDPKLVTFAPKVEREECGMQWDLPALTLHNRIRAANPEPGSWAAIGQGGGKGQERKELKLWKSLPLQEPPAELGQEIGSWMRTPQGTLIVRCKIGALELLEVQPEGKKRMSTQDWLRGYQLIQDAFKG